MFVIFKQEYEPETSRASVNEPGNSDTITTLAGT